jgi:hypothetical protein
MMLEHAQIEEEASLRSEVEGFAAEFFTLPVAERRRRLADLTTRGARIPTLTARLWDLSRGVALDLAALQDANFRVNWLARYVCDLLVCRPIERAARRHALLESMNEEKMALWETAARRLQKHYRAVAALEAIWIDELANWTQHQRRLAKARRRARPVQAPAAQGTRPSLPTSWLVMIGLGISMLFRLLAASHKTEPPPFRSYPVPTAPVADDWRKYVPERTDTPNPRQWYLPPTTPWKPGTPPRKPQSSAGKTPR